MKRGWAGCVVLGGGDGLLVVVGQGFVELGAGLVHAALDAQQQGLDVCVGWGGRAGGTSARRHRPRGTRRPAAMNARDQREQRSGPLTRPSTRLPRAGTHLLVRRAFSSTTCSLSFVSVKIEVIVQRTVTNRTDS